MTPNELASAIFELASLSPLTREEVAAAMELASQRLEAIPVAKVMSVEYPETPAGKRSFRRNIYGNIVGYVSGKRFWEFGCGASAEGDAQYWVDGWSLEDVMNGEALAADFNNPASRHHY